MSDPRSKPPAILLYGPTASGKTELALALHERFPLDIISVDSAQIYRGMDIGTAKPDAATQRRAPHALIDIRDPEQSYSAANFRDDALALMLQSSARGRVPLLVGGTFLYFRALVEGLAPLPDAQPALRELIEEEAEEHGWDALHGELARVDPASAQRIHPNDSQRIARALEVYRATGKPLTRHWRDAPENELPFALLKLALMPEDRKELHQRIQVRFGEMLEAGFLDEVESLRQRAELSADHPSMRAVGYRQAWQHLEGETDYDQFVHDAIVATRRYAKRQLTWLRKVDGLRRVGGENGPDLALATDRVATFLQECGG